jgi:diguanylate cyclase (GGDEF)-like protein
VLSKSRTLNFGIILVLGIIAFFLYGSVQQIEHTRNAEQLVNNINHVNNTLLKLDQLQQHVLLNHERMLNTQTFNNVQNFQFYTQFHAKYLQLFSELDPNSLIPYISVIQLNQLESYHDTLTKHQTRVITSFEFADVFQEQITPTLHLHSLISIEFIEFLHQLKSYIIENSSALTSTQSTAFIASEQFASKLLMGSLAVLFLAIGVIGYFFYLNTYLYQHIRGHYQQSTRAILTIDQSGNITQFNPVFSQVFSHVSLRKHDSHIKKIIGNHWHDISELLAPFNAHSFGIKRMLTVISTPSEPVINGRINYKMNISTAHGIKPMVLDIKLIQIFNKFRAIITFKDQSKEEAMQAQVNLDNFTQISNKTTILARLEDEIERCNRHHLLLSIIFIDIDEFKTINDRYGHPFGDKVIKWVASTIKKRVRETDYLGRYGGDEFMIVCPDCNAAQAKLIAQDIRTLLKNPKLHVKASVGVAQVEPEDTRESLLERADKALYQAKHQGKNKVVIYKQQSQR